MLDQVPLLEAKPPSLLVRTAGSLFSSIGAVIDQIEPYTHWWNEQNQQSLDENGPLALVIGDSTAIGVGATHPANSYVGRLLAILDDDGTHDRSDPNRLDGGSWPDTHQPWRVISLAQSGATLNDGLERQMPVAADLPPADLVICCLGTNDLVWGLDGAGARNKAERLVDQIATLGRTDSARLICPVAGGSSRARHVNRGVRTAAERNDLTYVRVWSEPGPSAPYRLASDRFHPNDLGYSLMAKALAKALGLEPTDGRWRRLPVAETHEG